MTEWRVTIGKTFQSELLNLEPKDMKLVQSHIKKLIINPNPDGLTKKQINLWKGKVYRIRAGNYRIIYSFNENFISLHSVRIRNKNTYKDISNINKNDIGGIKTEEDINLWGKNEEDISHSEKIKQLNGNGQEIYLPRKLNGEFLDRLRIPKEYWDELAKLKTESDLILKTPKTPDKFVTRIYEALFEKNINELLNEPRFHVENIHDLERFKKGDLLNFLLELSDEQKKVVNFGLSSEGPILVNGRAGTGKSTVAIYRVREIIKKLKETGIDEPKILFTTFSEQLISLSKQLLEQIINDNLKNVTISTADQILIKYYTKKGNSFIKASHSQLRWALEKSIDSSNLPENLLKNISFDYIIDEFKKIIIAFNIKSKKDYLISKRAGRKVPFNNNLRVLIWDIYEIFMELVDEQIWDIYENMRKLALKEIEHNNKRIYDAIIVDEAQDLDPNSIRSLIKLCKKEGHFFMTADANQSIYRGSFRWSDADDYFKLRGRVRNLSKNFRNTLQIMDGANDFLHQNKLDQFETYESVLNGPKPIFNIIKNKDTKILNIIDYFYKNCSRLGMSLGSCAIICRNLYQVTDITNELNEQNIPAVSIENNEHDYNSNAVKIMTCHTSKGLEFPNVIILADTTFDSQDKETNEGKEGYELEGRLMYVSMTRAMRSLKIITRDPVPPILDCNWNGNYWDLN